MTRHGRPSRATILVYYPDAAEVEAYARHVRAPRGRVTVHTASTTEQARPLLHDVDVLYAWKFPTELFSRAPRLRWLQVMGAGVDWALVPERPSQLIITRVPRVFGPWMAEYVLAWSLWVTQRMATYLDAQRERRWIGDVFPERLGGRTLAVIGLGEIGRAIARGARATGMGVVGVSRTGRAVPGVDRVWRVSGLRRALGAADVVVLTVPLTPATRGLIGAAELGAMRRTAWLVNIARGPVVDEAALLEALREKRIAGAILDVFAEEPLPKDHPFWTLPNVVVTPHVSGPSVPAEIATVFNENLARFLAGRPLRHVVDPARGY